MTFGLYYGLKVVMILKNVRDTIHDDPLFFVSKIDISLANLSKPE